MVRLHKNPRTLTFVENLLKIVKAFLKNSLFGCDSTSIIKENCLKSLLTKKTFQSS